MLNTKDNIDFKKVNINLKQELLKLDFNISHQSCLNLLSRALGYENYNTYSALIDNISNNKNTVSVKLEDIYKILKNMSLEDFFIPFNKKKFIYKNDTNLTIEKVEEKPQDKRFGYDYFFDRNHKEIEQYDPYDKLIKKLCEYKNFQSTYNQITLDTWVVKYNNTEIYYIYCITISSLSSLYVSLPTSINTFDFIYNFCIMNTYHVGSNTIKQVEKDLITTLNIKNSTFDDFIKYSQ
jgi:hypothetical protein